MEPTIWETLAFVHGSKILSYVHASIATFYAKNQHGSQIEKLIAARIFLIAMPFLSKKTRLSLIAGFFWSIILGAVHK